MARNIGPDSLRFSFLFFPPLSYQISFTAASAMLKYDYSCFHHQLDLFFDWFNPKSREFFFGFVFFRSVLLIFFLLVVVKCPPSLWIYADLRCADRFRSIISLGLIEYLRVLLRVLNVIAWLYLSGYISTEQAILSCSLCLNHVSSLLYLPLNNIVLN